MASAERPQVFGLDLPTGSSRAQGSLHKSLNSLSGSSPENGP